jgi:hypothetical protein
MVLAVLVQLYLVALVVVRGMLVLVLALGVVVLVSLGRTQIMQVVLVLVD